MKLLSQLLTSGRCGLILLLAVLLLSSCVIDPHHHHSVHSTDYSAIESFSLEVDLFNQDELQVDAVNGSIEIIGVPGLAELEVWGEREVQSESHSDARRHLDELHVIIIEDVDRIVVRTDQPDHSHGRNYLVRYYIRVPEDWRIVAGQANGDVYVANIENSVNVDLTNGELTVTDVTGFVNSDLVNGNMYLADIYGSVDADLTNGNIISTVVLPLSGTCKMDVVNGQINLSIPTITSAWFSAEVTNGAIQLSDLVGYEWISTPDSESGRLGAGEGLIELETTNGNINVFGF